MTDRNEIFSGTKQVDDKLKIDKESLNDYLKKLMGNNIQISDITQFKGGQSNPTYLVETNINNFVLRRKPPGKLLKSAHAVDRECRVMTALHDTDVPVPKTFGYCDDETVIGTPFFVMDHVVGNIYWELLLPGCDPNQRREIYLSMNDLKTYLSTAPVLLTVWMSLTAGMLIELNRFYPDALFLGSY